MPENDVLLSDLPMNAQVGPSERNAVSFRVVPFKNDIRAIHRHHEAGAVETIRNKTRITYENRTNGQISQPTQLLWPLFVIQHNSVRD